MLFATDQHATDESSFSFFNFATRQYLTGRKLPAEAVAGLAGGGAPLPPWPGLAAAAKAWARALG